MAEESQVDQLPQSAVPADSSTTGGLTEDLVLARLRNRDLPTEEVGYIVRDAGVMKSRKIRITLAAHPQTPRRVALRLIRELYTFELVKFAQMPAAAADLKRIADVLLVSRLTSVSLGERISLARLSSQRVAAALLLDKEKNVWQPALENSRLTEDAVVRALQKASVSSGFVEAAARHTKWSLRMEVRAALLRNAHTPMARAIEFARGIPAARLRDILHTSHLPEKIKEYLRKELKDSAAKPKR
jgi:hypothetical protein